MSSCTRSDHRLICCLRKLYVTIPILECWSDTRLKEWECVQVNHHKDVSRIIEQWQKNGWRLHTYSCAVFRLGLEINHYLLFERGDNE